MPQIAPIAAVLAVLASLSACGSKTADTAADTASGDGGSTDTGGGDGGSADGGASDGGASDGGSADGGADDTGGSATGASFLIGEATAGPDGYTGTEDWVFIGDDGEGEEFCRIRTTLSVAAVRDDCEDCDWAYDLVRGDAEVLTDTGPGCLALAGYDATTVSDLDGTTVAYGYSPDYFGHAEVLMGVVDGAWTALAFATWDEATGAFSYEREAGYFEY